MTVVAVPTVTELKHRIPTVLGEELQRLRAEFADLPEWQQRQWYAHEAAMLAEGWIRWRPSELLGLETEGPARKARNLAAKAMQQLAAEGVLERFEQTPGRTYAVRLCDDRSD